MPGARRASGQTAWHRRRPHGLRAQDRAQRGDERILRVAPVEQGQRLGARNAIDVMIAAEDDIFGRIERVHQIVRGG